jgi:hypothetical protein
LILDQIGHRHKRAAFDSFIDHRIDYSIYKASIYSICYPDGNIQIADPAVGWSGVQQVLDKYYFNDILLLVLVHRQDSDQRYIRSLQ